jgi:hypothetical protein
VAELATDVSYKIATDSGVDVIRAVAATDASDTTAAAFAFLKKRP